jgi:uncharacterized repeat protein (TIGR03803 family)
MRKEDGIHGMRVFTCALLLFFGPAAGLRAQTNYQQLMFFDASRQPGANPQAGLIFGSDGALHGTAPYPNQAVFAVNTNGTGQRVFPAGSMTALTVGSSGALYGMESSFTYPALWRIHVDGSDFEVLYNGSTNSALSNDGYNLLPGMKLVIGPDGAFYGTTEDGGSKINGYQGTIFKINQDGSRYQKLHDFGSVPNDGTTPWGGLIAKDGALYGTTRAGGTNSDPLYEGGTVYKINPDGSGYQVIHSFEYPQGTDPASALLLGQDGLLYGTTANDSTNASGSVFQLTSDGSSFAEIYAFPSDVQAGSVNSSALAQGSDGLLYGVTCGGGNTNGGSSIGMGLVFKLTTNGQFSVLHTFSGEDGGNDPAVSPAAAPLCLGSDGTLYGTTFMGGASQTNQGVVFKLSLSPPAVPTIIDLDYESVAVVLTFSGAPSQTWQVQAATDLTSWATLTSTATDTNGLFQFTDTQAGDYSQRFYRSFHPATP